MNDNVGSSDVPYHSCCHWNGRLKMNRRPIRSVVMPKYKG